MSELPKGWADTNLGEITVLRGEKLDPATVPDAPFVGLEDIEPHTSRILKSGKGSDVKSSVARFSAGDVLYSRLRPYLNKVTVPDFDGVASAEILVLEPTAATEAEFVRRRIMTREFLDFAALLDKGDRPRVNFKEISEFQVALPPLSEQQRIVAKVDGLTARTARARKELDRIPTLIARYKQRLLHLAFSGALIGRSFDECQGPLSSVVMKLDQGWSPKCENFPSEDPSIWGVIKTTAIQPVEFLEYENKQLPAHLDPRPKIEISAGEVLVTRAGPRNRVGIACYVRSTRPRLMLADKVYRLAIDSAKADPLYVTYILNSPDALSIIESMKSGGSESGLNLTQDKFLGLGIPVPSLSEQADIVRRIESTFSWLDRMATDHAAADRLLPKLDAAILAKAFRGELVPQDPNDEPANVLLDRITREREATPKVKRGRKANLPPITGTAEITLGPVTVSATGTVGKVSTRARKVSMTKSRQDDDVKGKPYLASLLKSGRYSDAQSLFRGADLPVADFYKQLAWEIDKGHILDSADELKAA